MIRKLLLLSVATIISAASHAQFRYTFKDTTTAYAALSGATSLNGSLIWDEENITAPIPFNWTIDSAYTLNKFNLILGGPLPGVAVDTNNLSDLNGFLFADVDIADRGLLGTTSLSPIRYLTTGSSPNRIFKVELSNTGFFEEANTYGTMNDYFNLQIWVYETSNIVELHFGSSQITYPSDYYLFSANGPLTGYAKHIDYLTGSSGNLYYLKGSAASPILDTNALPSFPTTTLSSWPASGKVYRYTPKKINCAPVANYTITPLPNRTFQFTYTGTTPVDSVIWDFGDGQISKTMNPSHIYSIDGNYAACVTAFNTCGNNRFCKPQIVLAVNNLAGLGNVKVYPNPAKDFLIIEGMQDGGVAILQTITGQQVLTRNINSTKQTIDMTALPAGTYLLILSNKTGARGTAQVVKQ